MAHWLDPVSRKKGANDLSPLQKLLLVLMWLRHNHIQDDLTCRFCIEQSLVSWMLNNLIPLLSAQLKRIIKWSQATQGPIDVPYNFLPNAVAIIDGTEIFLQLPSNLYHPKTLLQRLHKSDYCEVRTC